ncbi:MAG: hypothetical protein AVDCRST_MAG13-170 [uncultured Solirubrobacteraceae bacterium]|uniref:Uncharacterized protein n=1 Tax=uncultured Solirubrobacteraceae bacterium TaxID=1162706 RepID=A0A6J4RHA7_9ACTN|nr:MAG: hypothetical protein AVDCRST_MAG13-170 [uncultured Solirubrobacteraceae bacterium]
MQERRDLVGPCPHDGQLGRDVLAQRLEGAQEDGQALALDGLADEGHAQDVARLAPRAQGQRLGGRAGDVHAVGDDGVAAAVEAPARPRGRLGDGDPHPQAVQPAAGAERHPDAVGDGVLRVAVEGPHEGDPRGHQRVPSDDGRVRLVQVDDVVGAERELPAQRRDRVRGDGDVRDRPVGGEADRPPERHDVVGHGPVGGRVPAVQAGGQAVGRVRRGEDAGLVALRGQLPGEGLDVAHDAARIGPGVGGHQRHAHAGRVSRGVVGPGGASRRVCRRWSPPPTAATSSSTRSSRPIRPGAGCPPSSARRTSASSSPPARTSPRTISCSPSPSSGPAGTRTSCS